MKITLDEHLQSLLEYMQKNIPASKLVGVAEKVPDMARLLWEQYSQEPFRAIQLGDELMGVSHEPQSTAI